MKTFSSFIGVDESLIGLALEKMSNVELERFLFLLDRITTAFSEPREDILEARKIPSSMAILKNDYSMTLASLWKDVQDEKMSVDRFVKEVDPVIRASFQKAYSMGVGRELRAGDTEWIRRAADQEIGYAKELAVKIADGEVDAIDFRANNYAAGLDGISWNGMIESQSDDVIIEWKLGQAEHCPSCILLSAHSPYSKMSLPTTPRAGDTECRMNCKCSLVFKQGMGFQKPDNGVFGIAGQLDDEMPIPVSGKNLADWLKPLSPPDGLRLPSQKERRDLDMLYNEMNYQRRLVSVLDPNDEFQKDIRKEAIAARRELNQQIVKYMEERDIWDSPMLSVDEVIDGKKIPELAEREIFELGISGKKIGVEHNRFIASVFDKFVDSLTKKFGG